MNQPLPITLFGLIAILTAHAEKHPEQLQEQIKILDFNGEELAFDGITTENFDVIADDAEAEGDDMPNIVTKKLPTITLV